MKTAFLGRLVFGGSLILFGIICLMWQDADTWQIAFPVTKLPLGNILGDLLMIALIIGGIGIMIDRFARIASIVLSVAFALFALDYVPVIARHATVYGAYGSFFEVFSMLCGALAIYAVTSGNAIAEKIAHYGLGVCAISFMMAQIVYPQLTAPLVPAWLPPNQMFWTYLTDVAFGLAAIAILINRQARLATRLMTLMIGLFGLLVWVPAVIAHPAAHGDWSEFAYNFLITGACWMVSELQSLR